ncbi:S9 family peptidase [Algoriphagus sp.]|uniref:S9 family peptidase n=1 Tax=Algoriphagus sp. TaxID=1872435 RepID=UPI00262B3A86|nr:S9 family peptidase [Algoriphagus sp.]
MFKFQIGSNLLLIHFFVYFGWIAPSHGQGKLEDYTRAALLKDELGKVYHAPSSFVWTEDGAYFWYTKLTPAGREYWKMESSSNQKSPLFESSLLAKLLIENGVKEIKEDELYIQIRKYDPKMNRIDFQRDGYEWAYYVDKNELIKGEEIEEKPQKYWGSQPNDLNGNPVVSPDKTKTVLIRSGNLFLEEDGQIKQLTFDGAPGEYYSEGIQWSPDGKKLAVIKTRPAEVRKLTLLESSPMDQLQPRLIERDYRKPGDALPIRIPVLINLEANTQVEVPMDLIPEQYSVGRISWREDSSAFTFEYNQRGHQVFSVIEVNSDGSTRELIREVSPTFIDYSGKYFRRDLADGKEIIWSSERNGFRHLYLMDGQTGEVKNPITKGNWVVREVLHVDEQNRKVYLMANGLNKGEDPYHTHLCTVNFDGSDFTVHTKENANYQITFSPDRSKFVATLSRQDLAPVSKLFSFDEKGKAKEQVLIEKADISELTAAGWQAPEIFSAKGRDGQTDIWGLIIKPTNLDPSKKYPVIEYIYAGPHSSHVPKNFRPNYNGLNELAELGFIVVQIDGMGTSNRSKAFHDVAYQNLKDAGFPDRKLWIKAAAQSRSYMDINRVGIFGTSAGGQSSAGALIFHHDFYKVAVSASGCHDNRMDKIWWNEQWMGKLGPHYLASSNTVNAHKLEGKLMLIVGELDDNVDPASTFQFADVLVKEMKDFELIYLPGAGHTSGGAYGERKRRDFFVKNLWGVDPPAWDN